MNISQVKDTVESNLATGKFILSELEVASESVPQFLSELPDTLQFKSANSIVYLEDTSALRVENCLRGNWDVPGIAADTLQLQNTEVALVLKAGDTLVEPALSLSGSLQVPGLDPMCVTGTMSHPESWMIDFSISTEQLPSLTQIARLSGITGIEETLEKLHVSLPIVTAVRFGFNISTASFTYIGLEGSLCFGTSELDVLCMFTPDLIILGKIPDGRQILLSDLLAALSLDATSFPQVQIANLVFYLHPASQSYSFEIALQGDWGIEIGNRTTSLTRIGVEFGYAAQTITAAIFGEVSIDETSMFLDARLDETGNWKFRGGLSKGSTVKLRSVINTFLAGSLELPSSIPDMGCKDITLSFTPKTAELSFQACSDEPWNIPIGVDGLSISNINLSIEGTKGEDNKSQVKGNIGGTLNIGTTNFTATYDFPGDFALSGNIPSFKLSPLVQDLCGGDVVRGISLPPGVLDIELKDIAFNIAPQKGEMALSAGCEFGKAEIQIQRAEGGKWGFTVGFMPPEQWQFSALHPSLSALDRLKFSDTVLILASAKDESFALTTITTPGAVAIKPGLNLFATLRMAGLGVDELLKIESLTVYTLIGSDLRSLALEAQVEGEFALAKNVAFGDMKFCLKVVPPNFDVSLEGRVRAILDSSELNFIGALGIQITPPAFKAYMQATMQGCWQDPFGTKGLAITDVALDLGIAFPPLSPAIGFTGLLTIGTFKGAAAFKFDPTNPRSNMVAIAFNQLYLPDVYDAFCPPEIKNVIPADIAETVLNIGFEKVKIYIVPQATTIGEISFEQGISLAGIMHVWGLTASASVTIDQASGLLVQGVVDPIDIGGVFKLTGTDGTSGASLYLDLRTGAKPEIKIDGAVQLLGICSATTLRISGEEFYFFTTGKIFKLFEAAIEVRGGDLIKGDTIYIKAAMRNDLFAYLREKVAQEIKATANAATSQLTAAQQELTKGQNAINGLQEEINSAKARIYQLNCEIADKQRWYDNSPWWEKSWKWAELSAFAAPRYAEIGALYAKIGTLEAAKHVAFGALEVAKWALEGLKLTVGAAANVGTFITNFGLGGLIDIREARFEGTLNATAGGSVFLSVSLTFMNQPRDITLAFNFTDPLSSAKQLANLLLPALPA